MFSSGLSKAPAAGGPAERWKVEGICYYVMNDAVTPSYVIDVTDYYARKRQALDCHSSQFSSGPGVVGTRLNTPLFRQLVESRDAQFGAQAGVTWAEGVVVREPVLRSTIFKEPAGT